MITFKNVSNQLIEGSSKKWNEETLQHESIYIIKTAPKNNIVVKNGIEQKVFTTIKQAKEYIYNEELKDGVKFDEIEKGCFAGGLASGGVCICGNGNGFKWGNI